MADGEVDVTLRLPEAVAKIVELCDEVKRLRAALVAVRDMTAKGTWRAEELLSLKRWVYETTYNTLRYGPRPVDDGDKWRWEILGVAVTEIEGLRAALLDIVSQCEEAKRSVRDDHMCHQVHKTAMEALTK